MLPDLHYPANVNTVLPSLPPSESSIVFLSLQIERLKSYHALGTIQNASPLSGDVQLWGHMLQLFQFSGMIHSSEPLLDLKMVGLDTDTVS